MVSKMHELLTNDLRGRTALAESVGKGIANWLKRKHPSDFYLTLITGLDPYEAMPVIMFDALRSDMDVSNWLRRDAWVDGYFWCSALWEAWALLNHGMTATEVKESGLYHVNN